MAFLDNSGDIILDAVLTDTGRYRLAQGNGSFKITKFALADDEINYGSYDKNNPSGSAYYDLQILQTPILEAFTDNAASMKSKLISIARTNLLYLPVIVANTLDKSQKSDQLPGAYVVAVDVNTVGTDDTAVGFILPANENNTNANGIQNGNTPGNGTYFMRVDQGLNTKAIAKSNTIDAELNETQYIIEMDNRLGSLVSQLDATPGAISFIDDDGIASYYLSLGTDNEWVSNIQTDAQSTVTPILGPAGTSLKFKIQASTELRTSTYLFERLGSTGTMLMVDNTPQPIQFIDTTIKVTGATTGYRIDLPVRYIKKAD